MKILSHRGYWRTAGEKNRPVAFRRSFDLGFGTETDLRDHRGELVIAHDMPVDPELTLDGLLGLLGARRLPLAINVKADGLGSALAERMRTRDRADWFTFDMSVPEMVQQIKLDLPVYTRASEFERPPPLYDRAVGVWLDGFEGVWFDAPIIETFLRDGKAVCVVSPELHGRPHDSLWQTLRAGSVRDHPALTLCTDLPEDAQRFFGAAA